MISTVRLLLLVFCLKTATIRADLIVNTTQGSLKGKESISVLSNTKYYTFAGIPFAKPPVGELRFMPPVPFEKWDGILDATQEKSACVQASLTPKFMSESLTGDEDCLYLNVYTPESPSDIKVPKAVMVWIHGGAFYIGRASREFVGPDFLIGHDVVIVFIQYRLQALGFLNLGIPEASGNQGLKDQTLALKWVKQNIRYFGGDPDKITIFGQSAGASSVHHHMYSPLSAGLFHKVIMESGHGFTSWAVSPKTTEPGYALGENLGFVGNTSQQLVEFLKTKSAYEITKTVHETLDFIKGLAFIPTIETVGENKFLPDWPRKLQNNVQPMPIIVGTVAIEWQGLFSEPQSNDEMEKKLQFVILHEFKIVENSHLLAIVDKIKKFYLGDKQISNETIGELLQIPQDLFVIRFYDTIENKNGANAPTYMYQFDYLGNLSTWLSQFMRRHIKTATIHGEELGYLFYVGLNFPDGTFRVDPNDMKIIEYICSLWTNFAKTGNPSYDDVDWPPSTPSKSAYLQMNLKPKLIRDKIMTEDRFKFWIELMETEKLQYRY